MAVKIRVQTDADTAQINKLTDEIQKMRKAVLASDRPVQEVTKELRKLNTMQRTLNKLTPDTTSRFGKLKDMFGGFVITAGDVLNVMRSVASIAVESAKAYQEARGSMARLENTLANMPALAGETTEAFKRQADAIERSTAADADNVIAAQAMLGTFRLTGDEIRDITPLVVDYSRKFGVDMVTAATSVGKALDGQIGALKRNGVSIDQALYKADRYAAVQQALRDQVGGFAALEAEQGIVSFERLEVAVGNLKEAFGEGLMGDTSAELQETIDVLHELEPMAKGAGEALVYTFKELDDFMYQATAQAAYALGGLSTAGEMMYDAWRESGANAEMSLREFMDEVDAGTITVDGLAVVTDEATGATANLTGATMDATAADQDASAAKGELVRAMDGQKVAADSLAGIERTLAELTNDAAQADYAAKDALADYNKAVKEHGKDSDEAGKAKLRLEDANWRAADATADLNAKQEELGKTLDEAAKDTAYEKWLTDMRDRARELAKALGNVSYQSGAIAGSSGSGGRVLQYGAGGVIDEPQLALVGERGHTEYAITTEPLYRSRSLDLYAQLGRDLGVTNNNQSSVTVNVNVADTNASPTSIAAEVERVLKDTIRNSYALGRA